MADVAVPVTSPAAKAKKARKVGGAAKAKKISDHPKYSAMIKDALNALKDRGGSSRQAILKYIVKQYKMGGDERTVNAHLKLALRAGVKNGSLKQSKGTGAAGSFRLGEKKITEKKHVVKKTTGGVVKPKKPAAARKPKPKAVRKPKVAGSPKKAAKPKAAKPKSPKPKASVKPKKAKAPKAKSPKKAAKPKVARAKKVVKK